MSELWSATEDPGYPILIFAVSFLLMIALGFVLIIILVRSVLAALLMVPLAVITLSMLLIAKSMPRYKVVLGRDWLIVIRGKEERRIPISELSSIRAKPLLMLLTLRVPVRTRVNPRLSGWLLVFMGNDGEIMRISVSDSKYRELKGVLSRLCGMGRCVRLELH